MNHQGGRAAWKRRCLISPDLSSGIGLPEQSGWSSPTAEQLCVGRLHEGKPASRVESARVIGFRRCPDPYEGDSHGEPLKVCTVTAARRSACALLLRLAIGSDWQNDAVRRSGIEVLIKIGRGPSRGRWQDHFFPIAWRPRSHRCCRQALTRRWIQHRIARREIESSQCLGQHRWVVERTLAQFAQLRLFQPLRATGYRFRLLKPGRRLRCLALHRTIVFVSRSKS